MGEIGPPAAELLGLVLQSLLYGEIRSVAARKETSLIRSLRCIPTAVRCFSTLARWWDFSRQTPTGSLSKTRNHCWECRSFRSHHCCEHVYVTLEYWTNLR